MHLAITATDAARLIPDGASLMFGGFMGVGTAERVVDALVARKARGLTIIGNDTARPGVGVGKLIDAGCVARVMVSHIGTNPVTQQKMIAGEIAVELIPQGTLAERIRAGGCGLGGILTPTGVGTLVQDDKRLIEVDGRTYLLERPLRADRRDPARCGAHARHPCGPSGGAPAIMDAKELIARRVALELRDRTLVNLGIGLPTLVARYVPPGINVAFQSENGIIGLGAPPPHGMEDPNLTDAGGGFISALPSAASFDSAISFALIRGGHLAMTVLGGLQVDAAGRLANWMVPGKLVPGMGGAMDLVTGARRVVVAMQHVARGEPKIVRELTLPPTADRPVSLVVTDMAVIEPTEHGLLLRERAPGVSVEAIVAVTAADLLILDEVPEMPLIG
jgi:acetate CoA/acetoacetate CoA-transferase beta subunit